MAGAAEALSKSLSEVTFLAGTGAFFSTTEVRAPQAGELAEVMARQLLSPVKFSQSMEALLAAADAPDQALEVGPGNVLSGLMKRIAKDLPVASTGDADSLDQGARHYGAKGGA